MNYNSHEVQNVWDMDGWDITDESSITDSIANTLNVYKSTVKHNSNVLQRHKGKVKDQESFKAELRSQLLDQPAISCKRKLNSKCENKMQIYQMKNYKSDNCSHVLKNLINDDDKEQSRLVVHHISRWRGDRTTKANRKQKDVRSEIRNLKRMSSKKILSELMKMYHSPASDDRS